MSRSCTRSRSKNFSASTRRPSAPVIIRYYREADESVERVAGGKADVAFLIKPVTLEQMKDISLNLEVMPQKSTDFYPKLLSGLAMYTLDGE